MGFRQGVGVIVNLNPTSVLWVGFFVYHRSFELVRTDSCRLFNSLLTCVIFLGWIRTE